MSTETEDKIQIKEQADGSATVDLPQDLAPQTDDDDGDEAPESKADANSADDPADADSDDDSEALRTAKRERRRAKRELARKTSAEKDQRLQLLQRQNQELMERLSVVERKTHAGEIAKLDRAVEDQELRLEYAKRKIAEATRAQDGDALAQAQELWYESRQQLEALKNLKKASTSSKQPANLPDARVQKMAAKWINRNDWYDPQNRDTDSRIIKQIDEELTSEGGWDPGTEEYWDELDERAKKYLPHRYDSGYNAGNQRQKPRNMQTGTGRESSNSGNARGSFTLSPEQVRAMKDAGFWDDPAKRSSMIKRYAAEARRNSTRT